MLQPKQVSRQTDTLTLLIRDGQASITQWSGGKSVGMVTASVVELQKLFKNVGVQANG